MKIFGLRLSALSGCGMICVMGLALLGCSTAGVTQQPEAPVHAAHAAAPRIPALSPDQFTPEQAEIAKGREMYNLTRVFVNHPDVYRTFVPFAEQLMRRSNLPPRDREILILRTTALCGETYETGHHLLIAPKVGLTDAEVAAVRTGQAAALSRFDRALMTAAEEMVRNHRVTDATWRILAERYSRIQLMEAVFLVGDYTMVSIATNTFGVQGDPH